MLVAPPKLVGLGAAAGGDSTPVPIRAMHNLSLTRACLRLQPRSIELV